MANACSSSRFRHGFNLESNMTTANRQSHMRITGNVAPGWFLEYKGLSENEAQAFLQALEHYNMTTESFTASCARALIAAREGKISIHKPLRLRNEIQFWEE
jgi:hypothetical protein